MGANTEQTLTVLRLCEQHDVGIVINLGLMQLLFARKI